ncbi:epidermal growth factor-like protein 7 isoform X1 [Octopus sinensis]|uniref:Epidermal growth factor-like protein 7 isoform X1 n=2 Tax=Octopus sinensis TaxID=2607531 RepID=A0A6P7U0E5_9MOLL|nr:epidermal growth factor-like protein 7 isoform X1 [Octopus sinensis]
MFTPLLSSSLTQRPALQFLCIVMFLTAYIDAQIQFHRPGRHVCQKQRVVQSPIREQETISHPIYQRVMRPCRSSVTGYCSTLKVVQQKIVRYVIRFQAEHQVMYTCCPGWSQHSQRENACLKPVCSNPCQNGGECGAPNKCICPKQWTDKFCQTDVNECISGQHKCQHNCVNTYGSYKCSCNDGFKLMSDGFSCTLCLMCSREYKQMQDDYKQLSGRVVVLEKEKTEVHNSVSELYQNLNQCMKQKHQERKKPAETEKEKIPVDWEPVEITDKSLKSVERMIRSMREQIGLLEERIEECVPQEVESST